LKTYPGDQPFPSRPLPDWWGRRLRRGVPGLRRHRAGTAHGRRVRRFRRAGGRPRFSGGVDGPLPQCADCWYWPGGEQGSKAARQSARLAALFHRRERDTGPAAARARRVDTGARQADCCSASRGARSTSRGAGRASRARSPRLPRPAAWPSRSRPLPARARRSTSRCGGRESGEAADQRRRARPRSALSPTRAAEVNLRRRARPTRRGIRGTMLLSSVSATLRSGAPRVDARVQGPRSAADVPTAHLGRRRAPRPGLRPGAGDLPK